MPIPVTCPSCHARFQVSDKFAGKKGPCPKCKGVINIPRLEQQVKIDDRSHGGTKDATGKLVLKPIERAETKAKPVLIGAIAIGVLATIGLAWFIGSLYADDPTQIPWALLAGGALVIGVPVAAGGYMFLRDDELEPYSGMSLWLRALVCSACYAVLWLIYYNFVPMEYRRLQAEPLMSLLAVLPFVAIGTVVAFAAFDLSVGSAVSHYVLYLVACIVLSSAMGWPMFERGPSGDEASEDQPAPLLVPQLGR